MPHTDAVPSLHALNLAGVDLPNASPPVVRAEAADEILVVLSRSRSPGREVHLERCRADGIPVVTRPSGGGAVVLAPGVVVASALASSPRDPGFPERYFRHFCGRVTAALEHCGVRGAAMRGVSDLCLGDRKIAGSSLRLLAGKVLFQVSVLVDPDVSLLARYLRHPSREPAYRAGRDHREFLVTLHEAGHPVPRAAVVDALRRTLNDAVTAPLARPEA